MAKQKKKRNKVYRGKDAATIKPIVTRVEAANRNQISQWWFEKKRIAKPLTIAGLVVVALIIIVAQIIRLVGGN